MKKILILCTGNSCRSQIAHGFLDHLTNNSVSVFSAGIEKHGLNKNAVKCMAEIGLDISDYESNHIDKYINESFDFIITVCDHAKENCPFIASPNAVRLHHNFYDPSRFIGTKKETHAAFLKARTEIKDFMKAFVDQTF